MKTLKACLLSLATLVLLQSCDATVTSSDPDDGAGAILTVTPADPVPVVLLPNGQTLLPATGPADASSVLCTGAQGQFYMNFPDISFERNQFGETIAVPGEVTIGYRFAGQVATTVYDDPYVTAIANGDQVILQTHNAQSGFTAFFAVDSDSPNAWIQGSGDTRAYAFDGDTGSMSCVFYQDNINGL